MVFGCATAPTIGQSPYRPSEQNGDGYGYADTQINDRTFQVYFAGVTERDARDGAMVRAAEVVARRGFDGFAVTANDEHSETRIKKRFIVGRVRRPLPTAQLTVVGLMRQDFQGAESTAYDARMILQQHPSAEVLVR